MKTLSWSALVAVWCLHGCLLVSMIAASACTPGTHAALVEAAPALERATCVVIRAFTTDGRILDVCATADELAPLVSELLGAREERPESNATSPIVAFAITPSRKRVARRRCVVWQSLEDVDASTAGDGGPSP